MVAIIIKAKLRFSFSFMTQIQAIRVALRYRDPDPRLPCDVLPYAAPGVPAVAPLTGRHLPNWWADICRKHGLTLSESVDHTRRSYVENIDRHAKTPSE